jgi:CBS domain-containing protein
MPTAQDILSRKTGDVASIAEDATVLDAAKMMNERRIGSLVVVRADKVVGIFSERDVLFRIVAETRDPATTRVGQVMTSPVAVCHPATKLAECRSVMTDKKIRHLPVVSDGKLVGMISSGDILAMEQHEQQQTIEYLHEYLREGTR